MTNIPTWGFFILGVISAAVAVFLGKGSSKLLQGKSIDEVVNRANAIVDLYEAQVKALEDKVEDLTGCIGELKTKLEETLKHNEALQKLLASSPSITLPQVKP